MTEEAPFSTLQLKGAQIMSQRKEVTQSYSIHIKKLAGRTKKTT